MPKPLIKLTSSGLYCPPGRFYIDPWKPVGKAVISHAHADHAYRGSRAYLASEAGKELTRRRLGEESKIQTIPYGETVSMYGVEVSFHPAGHVLGSSQVRVEHKGEVWVFSGDYKLTPDPTCQPFEPVKCDTFITEATFGLPIYKWTPPDKLYEEVNAWWRRNRSEGKASVMFSYALGKSQRILAGIDSSIGEIFTHGAVEKLNDSYRRSGVDLPPTTYVGSVEDRKKFRGALIVAPPSAMSTPWLKRFGKYATGFASGWMMVRGTRRRRAVDRGFVMSDHADWDGLMSAIENSQAERIFVTHGFIDPLVRWLNENGKNAIPLRSEFVGDDLETD